MYTFNSYFVTLTYFQDLGCGRKVKHFLSEVQTLHGGCIFLSDQIDFWGWGFHSGEIKRL